MAPIQPTLDSIRRLLELGKTSEALGQLEDFLEQNPRQVEAWWLAAQNVKSDDKKRICLQRILTLEPDHRGARAEMIALDGLDGEVSSATTSHSKSDAKQENGRKSMRTPDASGESYDDGLGEDDFDEIQVIEEEQETYAIASASSANAASSDGDVFDFSGPAKKPKSKARKDAATDWEDEYEEDEYEEYVEPETILGIPTTWIICAQLGIILLLVTTFAWSHYSTVAQIGKLEKKIGYLESDVSEATKVTDEQIRHMKDVQQSIEDVASQSSSLSTKLKSTNEVAHEAHQIAAASDRRVDNALTSSERAIKEAQDAKDSALESLDSVREIEQEVFELQQITSAVMQGELEEADAEGEAKNGNEEVANGDKKPEEVAVVERPLRLRRPAPKPRPPVDKNGEIRVKLPHPVVDVVPADGGKLLVLKLESLSGLLVFDTQQARLAGTISLPSEDFLYAAGGQKVLIYFKENGLMQV